MKNHPTNLDHDLQKGMNLMSSSMDKQLAASQDHQKPQQQQQEPLRCPRCDSSNTKFCYYNNYSLSQPRHFCKACKRYWTRGGTLRSVPVGGGCRKNKRIKRPTSSSAVAAVGATRSSSSPAPDSTSSSSTSNNNTNLIPNSIFYGSNSDLNVPFSGYDHHHNHLNALGLGFSSPNIDHRDFNFHGFNSSSLLSGYSSLFGSNNNPSTSISSLLLANSKFTNNGGIGFKSAADSSNLFENLASPPFDHHHHHNHQEIVHGMGSNGGDQLGLNIKDVKLEDGMKRLNWDHQQNHQTDQIIVAQSNDPNSLFANWSSQTWNDPTNNLASSITSSLI